MTALAFSAMSVLSPNEPMLQNTRMAARGSKADSSKIKVFQPD